MGEELICRKKPFNTTDPFAVAVVKNSTAVGHVPRKILSVCSLFLRKNGTIVCKVTGSRCYSRDLPQGGLEEKRRCAAVMPCIDAYFATLGCCSGVNLA